VVTIADDDLSDGGPRTAQLVGADDVQQLAHSNASSILQWFKDLSGWLDEVSRSAQLAASLPFTQDLKLNEVADFATALRTQVINRLINADGTPNFQTAQELLDRLAASATSGSPLAIGLNYDAGRKELVFRLNFGQTFERQA